MSISEDQRTRLRTAIIEAANAEFLDKGYVAASVDNIIKTAGGSKTKVYTYFGGKEELFREAVSNRCLEILEPLRQLTLPHDDVAKGLTEFGRAFLSAILEPETIRLFRLVIAESTRFPGLGDSFLDAGPRHAQKVLTGYLRRSASAGSFRTDVSPENAATLFIDMISRRFQIDLLVGVVQEADQSKVNLIIKAAVKLVVLTDVAPRSSSSILRASGTS